MSLLQFKLSWPPSANTLYATVNGRRVLSRKGRIYKQTVAQCITYCDKPLTCRLAAYLFLVEPDKRRRDIANFEKIVMDSLQQAGVMQDDSQLDSLHLRRYGVNKAHPHIWVMLEELIPLTHHRSTEETISA